MSEIGGLTLVGIVVRALGYGAGLVAVGSALFLVAYARRAFPASDRAEVSRLMRRTAWIGGSAAFIAVLALLGGLSIRAGRLSGLGLPGMADPLMLQIVWEGPVGTAVAVRCTGLAIVVGGLAFFRWRVGGLLTAAGAFAYAGSYALVGHAAEAPRLFLAALLAVHLLAVSFWLGAFAPLTMAARRLARTDAAALLDAFGRAASWVVAALVLAGGIFALVLVETPGGLLGTAYGRILLVKIALVAALLALAALNKLRLVPALAAGKQSARERLAASIRLEALAGAAILLTTATLTSVATPPGRLAAALTQ